ncbi:Crp/Fnr family transcriptional regulator [Campylobacter troglodytis]|uniref:Crp/Fnr family transcriptional regulator n=1 Tax=Campylobacter troglodytis TaxID=654363 RepID=UPI001159E008|nr:Crp/Fnr family transcriptional regulator [Campylobacter troglodytis]TQR58599.1 Crp/Fnr family transcriptional regulator [Campylobacter troglodytis]
MKEFVKELEKIGTKRLYKKGNIIFYEQDRAKSFFLLLRGAVRVYKSPSLSKEITLHLFKPLSFIAEMPAFKQGLYPASAICEEDSELLCLEFEDFKRLCLNNADFSLLMITSLFEKIRILERELNQNQVSLKQRFIIYVLENEARLNNLSQRQIATELNARAESLSRIIKALKAEKAITTNKGKIKLVSKPILQALLG